MLIKVKDNNVKGIKRENWKEFFTFIVTNEYIKSNFNSLGIFKFYHPTRECWDRDATIYWHVLLVPFIGLGYKIKWLWFLPGKKLKKAGYLKVVEGEPIGWFWLHRIRFKKKLDK